MSGQFSASTVLMLLTFMIIYLRLTLRIRVARHVPQFLSVSTARSFHVAQTTVADP